jgi:hypothetical protein
MEKELLLNQMKQDMLAEIKNAIKEVKLRDSDEVCYISLFGSAYYPVLSIITLGLKSCRDEIVQKKAGSSDRLASIWNCAEMPARCEIGMEDLTPSFADMQQRYNELTDDDDWEETWEACQEVRFEVAYQLNALDWSEIIPITDDFVVFSEWLSIMVKDGDLARSMPPEKLLLLKAKDLA